MNNFVVIAVSTSFQLTCICYNIIYYTYKTKLKLYSEISIYNILLYNNKLFVHFL